MTFLAAKLSDRITRGAQSTLSIPGRTKAYNPGGKLFQNFLATRPKHLYDVSHGLRSRDDFQVVLDAFIVVMMGGYDGLLFKDWRDYIASQSNSNCAVIDATHVQLQRKHTFGGVNYYRDILKPSATPTAATVYRTRAGLVSAIGATIDYTTGIAVIAGHTLGDTYTWAGTFDMPVTFTDNEWIGSLEVSTDNLHVSSAPIKLEEIIDLD